MITSIMAILMSGLVSISPYVFAAKSDPGFLGTLNCQIFPPGSKPANTTCCWKESDGETYCQTCTWVEGVDYTTCNNKELQMLDLPPNPSSSSPTGPTAPVQGDGILEKPHNPKRGTIMDNLKSDDKVLDSP